VAPPLISALYDELKIGQTIEEMFKWDQDQCHMSPGKWIKAIVINIFGRRRPLYRINEFYENMDDGFGGMISPRKHPHPQMGNFY
jgi:hypothetical protein